MNILYIAHRIPFPPDKGDKIRSFNQIKHLSKRHTIDLICLNDSHRNVEHQKNLERYCRNVYVYSYPKPIGRLNGIRFLLKGKPISVGNFYFNVVQATVDRMLTHYDYDVVFCFSSSMAEYVFNANMNNKREKVTLIMDFCDVDSDKWLQYSKTAKFPMKQVYANEYRLLKKYESRVYDYFDHSILISEYEKNLFMKIIGKGDKLKIVKNGVDTHYFSKEFQNHDLNDIIN